MGSLSRNFDGWRNYVHTHARNLGPGGQMAALMHEELESISDNARDIASTQRRSVEAMRAGFDQMTDAVGHLTWVQQRAHEEQLTAQYRVMQLQSEANGELTRANDTLCQMSAQLAEVAEILSDLRGTQDEHLQIVKAERTLKEVLFQLTTMLDDMILPEDEVARLFLCQLALDELDHYGLNTSHLSDLSDKRAFADFVKSTRKTVRDSSAEAQSDLLAFETWHKGYGAVRALWESSDAPLYKPLPAPEWRAASPPPFQPKHSKPKPITRTHPGEHPLPEQFGKMPDTVFVDGRVDQLQPYIYKDVVPGTFSPETVPTKSETRSRFPKKRKGFFQYIDSLLCSEEWENAQRYEQALRSWADAVRQYNSYVSELAAWNESDGRIARENEEEAVRHAEVAERFLEAEKQRRQEYETVFSKYRAAEQKRRDLWMDWLETFIADYASQGKTINAFLDDHPDIQLVYSKVDWEQDVAAIRRRSEQAPALPETPEGHGRHWSAADVPVAKVWTRAAFEELMNQYEDNPDEWLECPLCKAEVIVSSLVTHFNFVHCE